MSNQGIPSSKALHHKQRTSQLPPFSTFQLNEALVHDNGNVIIHILINIPQETRRNDADPPKGNADQVNILVARCVRRLPCRNDDLASGFIITDGGDGLEFIKQCGPGQLNRGFDVLGILHTEFDRHGATDIFDRVRYKFVDEDVVIDRIPDTAADDSNGKRQGRNSSDQILLEH